MNHMQDKHECHEDELFKTCIHEPLEEKRKWIKNGTIAYDKAKSILMNTMLIGDIKKLSSNAQTSCLEGYHSTLNHSHPRMIHFSWMGTVCRHILAICHFNENLGRATQKKKDGEEMFRVTYPKFKLGEEIVRTVTVAPTYEYAKTICDLLFSLPLSEMEAIRKKYSAHAPKALTEQFEERRTKAEAVERFKQRALLETTLYPPEQDQHAMQMASNAAALKRAAEAAAVPSKRRQPRKCRTCGEPMLGHKKERCSANKTTE